MIIGIQSPTSLIQFSHSLNSVSEISNLNVCIRNGTLLGCHLGWYQSLIPWIYQRGVETSLHALRPPLPLKCLIALSEYRKLLNYPTGKLQNAVFAFMSWNDLKYEIPNSKFQNTRLQVYSINEVLSWVSSWKHFLIPISKEHMNTAWHREPGWLPLDTSCAPVASEACSFCTTLRETG